MRRTILTGAVFAILSALFVSACSDDKEEKKTLVRPVLSAVVEERLGDKDGFAGIIAPRVETELGFRVSGLLVARSARVGDVVKKGQQLARLDPTPFELVVHAAEAEFANAQAELSNAESVKQRSSALLGTGTGTQAESEKSDQAFEQSLSSLVQAKTRLAKANEELSYAQILSPFNGVVTATASEVGQVLSTGDAVVTVAQPAARDAVVDVPHDSAALKLGVGFTVALQISPTTQVPGKVREVSPAADASTRTRRIKIALENPPESFRLGSTVTSVIEGKVEKEIVIPKTAIVARDGKSFVWILDTKTASVESREVTIGQDRGANVVVTGGLKAGESYVTAGVNTVKDGQKVNLQLGSAL